MRLVLRTVILATLLTAVANGIGCGGGGGRGGSPTAPEDNHILIITNVWVNEADGNHSFNLFSDDDGQIRGDFEGDETLPDFTTFELSGSWENNRIELTINRATPVAYRATLSSDNPNRLVFDSSEGSLVLVR